MSMEPEFSRLVRLDTIPSVPKAMTIEASPEERAALSRRFDLVAIDKLSAMLTVKRDGSTVTAAGRIDAEVTQSCVATGVPIEATVNESFAILFLPGPEDATPDDEIELSAADCDVVFYEGGAVDAGEAVAETLSLNLDPWPRAPGAEDALRSAGIKNEEETKRESSPFAGLAGLKKS